MGKTNLIKLKFLRNGEPSGREYTYICKSDVTIGDTVIVRPPESPDHEPPKGIITMVDVPESEVESFKDKLKEIVGKNLEKQVYKSFAFKGDERKKLEINREIYEELKKKWKILINPNDGEPFDDYDLVYRRKAAYHHGEYTILKNETNMTSDELALIFDGGNLCFGYKRERDNFYYVFED